MFIKSQYASYAITKCGESGMGKAVMSKRVARETKKQNLEADGGAVQALRTVGIQEAFYFYEAVGKPTGELARNLSDFLDKIKVVKSEILVFHLQIGDFQNWVEKTLGDSKLGKQLAKISSVDDESTRMKVCKTVECRIDELREPCPAVSIEDIHNIVPVRAQN
jgi:hypothetical protein